MEQKSIYLAPLQEFTDHVYRSAYQKHFGGIDKYYTPYLNLENDGRIKSRQLRDIKPENNKDLNVVPQFLPSNAVEMKALLDSVDITSFSEINLNLGCPYPMVTRKGRGSALIQDPDTLRSILDVCFAADKKVSIKLRLGLEDENEWKGLIDLFKEYDLEEIALHPRIAKQLYKGVPNHIRFSDFVSECAQSLVYNGDVNTVDDWNMITNRFPSVKAIMIGRGILMNPFLPEQIKGLQFSDDDRQSRLRNFHDDMFYGMNQITEGDTHLLRKMLTFWTYFSFAFSNQKKAFKLIKKAKNVLHYNDAVRSVFDQF